MCTDAYREALTRALSSTASSAPTPSQAAEAGRGDVALDDLESRGVAAAVAVRHLDRDSRGLAGEAADHLAALDHFAEFHRKRRTVISKSDTR